MDTSMETTSQTGAAALRGAGLEARRWLEAHVETPVDLEAAIRFFDACDAVATPELRGQWHGASLKTGHPFDELLEGLGWYGKAFLGDEEVHPLLFRGGADGLYSLNANLIPSRALGLAPHVGNAGWVRSVFRASGPLLRTLRPSARLRRMEHRGVTTATMVYDTLPIQDIYRRVDENTVIGWMDLRGMARPFLFVLRRDHSPGILFEKLLGAAGLDSANVSTRAKD